MAIEFLTAEMQHNLQGTCLFYPCSGNDLVAPITLFAPAIKSFWFADVGYFPKQGSATTAKPSLDASNGFELLSAHVRDKLIPESDWIKDPKYRGVEPCTRTEIYTHLNSGEEINVHRTRRRGPTALRTLAEPLGVFFYRGDSDEGGSGTLWLTVTRGHNKLFLEVLARLVDRGLIATDGSLCITYSTNRYRAFATVARRWDATNTRVRASSFYDAEHRRFDVLAHVGTHYGRHTLLWQVSGGTPKP